MFIAARTNYRLTAPLQTDFVCMYQADKIRQLSWTEVAKILENLAKLERDEAGKVCVG